MQLILTGATGLVGSSVLSNILSHQIPAGRISQLYILSRRPIPALIGLPNVQVIEHQDFSVYPEALLEKLKGSQACIWAMGVSQNRVSREDYVKITQDYPLAAAKALSELSDSFKFVYVSSGGANSSPTPLTPFYGRIQGHTETTLLSLPSSGYPSLKPFSVRLGYVDPANDPAAWETITLRPDRYSLETSITYGLMGPVLRALTPAFVSPTRIVGSFLTGLAMGNCESLPSEKEGVIGSGRIISNRAMREMSGL